MIRKHFRRKRLILGLAVATAFAAPVSAQAMVDVAGPTGGEQAYVIPKSNGIVVQSPAQQAAYQLKVDAMRGQALNNAYQLQVDAMRGQALNKTYADSKLGPLDAWAIGAISANSANQPGPTAAGTAIANARHDALPVSTVVSSTSTSDGVNWSDAGIGSAVTFGVVLFLLTAVGFGRKHRSGLARA
jgi:hypothetical protein